MTIFSLLHLIKLVALNSLIKHIVTQGILLLQAWLGFGGFSS
jgi:hypothetical protein